MDLTWLIPSFYGDVRLETIDKTTTRLIAEKVTVAEKKALEKLQKAARKQGWIDKDATVVADYAVLRAPVDKVAGVLSRALKPGRKLVSAVQFSDGAIREVTTRNYDDENGAEDLPQARVISLEDAKAAKKKADAKPEVVEPEIVKATTVAAPVRGCPAPDFPPAELRARQVLMTFLNPEQREDFLRYNRFITVGATTGHRYMITSRHARDELAEYQRSFYDLDERWPYCVHDWDVPAPEEMLGLHILCSLPGYEQYLRTIRDDDGPQFLCGSGIIEG